MGKTSIEWTDASWNPVVGCTEVSPGCANCYAARLAGTRLKNHPDYENLVTRIPFCEEHNLPLENGMCPKCRDKDGNPFVLDMQSIVLSEARWNGQVRFLPHRIEEPLHWRKPRRIFVCDMGDLFHESVSDLEIAKIFLVMQKAHWHTFQVLTKRPSRMFRFFQYDSVGLPIGPAQELRWPLPNVWLGVSVENQHFADERIPPLLATPADVRFLSVEPMLGSIDLTKMKTPKGVSSGGETFNWLTGQWWDYTGFEQTQNENNPHGFPRRKIDWVICGGESGSNARAMHPDWARSLRDQCGAAGVPFFFKQWGEHATIGYEAGTVGWVTEKLGKKKAGRLLDGREWNEFPNGH